MRLAPQKLDVPKPVLMWILATKGKSSTRVTSSPPTISNWVLQHTASASSSHSSPLSSEASLGHSGEKRGRASSFASSCKNRGQSTLCLHCQPSSHSPAPEKRSLMKHFADYSRLTCNDPSKIGENQPKEENHWQLHEERSHCNGAFPGAHFRQLTGFSPTPCLIFSAQSTFVFCARSSRWCPAVKTRIGTPRRIGTPPPPASFVACQLNQIFNEATFSLLGSLST